MISKFRRAMALAFTLIFCGLAVALAAIAVHLAAQSVAADRTWAEGLLKSLNMAVIALATFELGLGVHKEYAGQDVGADDPLRLADVLGAAERVAEVEVR